MALIFISTHKYKIGFLVLLFLSAFHILSTFPHLDEYYYRADEGAYFRQIETVKDHGLDGLKEIAERFISNKTEQVSPNPLRIGHILLGIVFLSFHNAISSLSYLSLLSFIILCSCIFIFFSKLTEERTAFIISALLIFSPLAGGMARRALTDSEYYLFISISLFFFISFIKNPNGRNLCIFIVSFITCCLIREVSFFMLPFFTMYLLWRKYISNIRIKLIHIVTVTLIPPFVVSIIYISLYGGIMNVKNIIHIMFTAHNEYIIYGSGPWYQYFLDYFILSPFTSIFFFFFIGIYIVTDRKKIYVNIILLTVPYFIIIYSFLPKDVRYVINIDLAYRIGAAIAIIYLSSVIVKKSNMRNIVTAIFLVLLLGFDVKAFDKIFIDGRVYDPIAFNLLLQEKIIPEYSVASKVEIDSTTSKEVDKYCRVVFENPSPENFLNLGLLFYNEKKYQESIRASSFAINMKPDFAEAYNNIAAAYGQLQMYNEEIKACEKALLLNPDFQLAKNNLEWAKSQLKK